MWYDVNWICKDFHPNCSDVENITGNCTDCYAPYILNTSTFRCDPPPCPPNHYRLGPIDCNSNPPYCVEAEDQTAHCITCLAPLYEVDPTNFTCRLKGCSNTEWRDINEVC